MKEKNILHVKTKLFLKFSLNKKLCNDDDDDDDDVVFVVVVDDIVDYMFAIQFIYIFIMERCERIKIISLFTVNIVYGDTVVFD